MSQPRRYKLPLIIMLMLAGIAIIALQLFNSAESPSEISKQPEYSLERTLRYSFTVQNRTSQLLQGASFTIYGPVKQTSFQKALDLSASHPFELVTDEQGNQQLRFELDFPPFGSKVVSITANVALSETPNTLADDHAGEHLGQQKYIEVNDPTISDLAAQFTNQDPMLRLKQAYSWVAENIAYAGYIEDDRGALYALQNKRGDCTEYMYLFSALARSQNIPARGIGGYVVSEDALLKARDFHNWSEVYIDNQWRVVDPQHKKFLETEHYYIAMRLLSSQPNASISNTHGFSSADEQLDLKMN